ncbi:DUF4328 domain-containing protein [Asticcacaulis sp. AC402]|uniref:DUF4328 domain-containing protein n=1 Tax=Asticcacaulis sp. AC402 TaxID=1282361 RepID=UPI0003C3B575|nr:DUF4328 domain-containing protein [Asticcacaulis sp. AC402]ESQ74034.1 hypothetical protein ABAC402_16180 [Asticcacaulis sp. AC402]
MMQKKNYHFRPLKALTTWTLILAGVKAGALALYALCNVVPVATGFPFDYETMEDPMAIGSALAGLLYVTATVIGGVVALVWFYGATRNTMAIRPTLTLHPGWAVGWWFVPFASLYKPYQYMRDIWLTAMGQTNGRYAAAAPPLLIIWWWTFLISNLLLRIADRFELEVLGSVFIVAGGALSVLATLIFMKLVRDIARNQVASDVRIADQF